MGHTWIAEDVAFGKCESRTCIFADNRINVSVMTPSGMRMCLLEEDFREENLPDFRCVYFCGERLEKNIVGKLWERFPHLHIINAYGPTEATSAVCGVSLTRAMLEAEDELPVGEVDKASACIRIVDGEIVLSGATVFRGYLNRGKNEPALTEYRTGDVGAIRDGLLYCKGRVDSQVKYKGYRIELYDIENNLNRIPGIAASAVVARKNEDGSVKTIQAYCVSENGRTDAAGVKNALRELLPEYMIPKTIRFVESLPTNRNGKTDRNALAEMN